jgi:hypothetical protein
VNPRFRIYAAVGLAGVVTLGGGFLVLGRGGPTSSAAVHEIKPLHPVKKSARKAARAAARKAAEPATRPGAVKKPLAAPSVPKTKPTDGMPAALSAALKRHSVVVVSLVARGATVDDLAYGEAKAGAAKVGAGFVRISVANNADLQALSGLVDSSTEAGDRLLDDPAVLVFRRPQELFVRINGYVDADTVAQAAANAAPVAPVRSDKSPLADPWVVNANAICQQLRTKIAGSQLPLTLDEVLPYVQQLANEVRTAVARLHALPAPHGKQARVAVMLAHYDKALASLDAMLAAARHGDRSKIGRLQQTAAAEGAQGDAIAAQLGAGACAGART